TERLQKEYIDKYLENAEVINYTDLGKIKGATTVFYDELQDRNMNGYPVASDFVGADGRAYSVDEFAQLLEDEKKKCRLRYYYLPKMHELYVGTTGSGKTTGCVEPQLRAISSQKNKPNLFITDPKGELFDRNAKHLRDNGYKIFVLNFKDVMRSDRWNPLVELYDLKMKLESIGNGAKKHEPMPVKQGLEKMAPEDQFGYSYIEYDGKAFPDGNIFYKYLVYEKDVLEAEIGSQISQIASMMIKVQSNTDRSWEYGAQELLKGLLYCMLEEAVDPSANFTRDMMTLKTLQKYYGILRSDLVDDADSYQTVDGHWLLKNKSASTKALLRIALGNAPNTKRSYCGVFDGAMKDWFQSHIFALTTGNTVDLEEAGDQPFVIFLITRDYEKSDFLIAGLFVDWTYRQMIERAERTKMPRETHFILDEFGNIPEIKDLENKISTSRSRDVWFHLVVQSYIQINHVYGDNRAVIFKDNCNAQIFLGAQNRETKETFAKECGKKYIPSLHSVLDSTGNELVEVPLI
ncbi:MAG: type IV secretory system conjugative DNA transfer family protein, partial [Clostridia bacterium]|nr:type IV secretory system conjugative DNA transfer family protein [Clostridia bacterium]